MKKAIFVLFLIIVALHFLFQSLLFSSSSNKEQLENDFKAIGDDLSGTVLCETSKGNFRISLTPHLAPNGTKFFVGLVKSGYFDQGIPFFRVTKRMTQFGITKKFKREDDPFVEFRSGADRDEHPFGGIGMDEESIRMRKENIWKRGTIASIGGFQFVIVIHEDKGRKNGASRHDAPLGMIPEEDMENVFDNIYKYNDVINNPKGGPGPKQGNIMREGMDYIRREFPLTDYIKTCKMVDLK